VNATPPDYDDVPDSRRFDVPASGGPLDDLAKRLARVEASDDQRRGALRLASGLAGLLTLAMAGAFGWTWTTNTELVRVQSALERTQADLDRLEAEESPAITVTQNSERIRALEQRFTRIEAALTAQTTALTAQTEKLNEILEHVSRRRR